MTHYIDKDRIVAEIEKIIADETESIKSFEHGKNVSEVQRSNARIGILIHIRSLLDTLEVEELPIWEKVSPDTGQTTLYKDGDKSYLERFGYRIDLKDLDKLPKKNSTHRTTADIEVAMQEVEEKSEAYTDAHRGERDDDVLSQMRGEPVSEDLDEEIDRAHRIFYDEVGWDSDEGARAYVADWFAHYFANWQKHHMEANRIKHCNSITNEQAELEQGFIDQHLDKYNRMPTFLDAIEYGMRLQKEQMMKGAILETEVLRDSDGDGVDTPYESWLTLANTEIPELPENLGLKEGDKVKIVIVKSEQK